MILGRETTRTSQRTTVLAAALIGVMLVLGSFMLAGSVGPSEGLASMALEWLGGASWSLLYLGGSLGLGLWLIPVRRERAAERLAVAGGLGLTLMLSLSHGFGTLGLIGTTLGAGAGQGIAWAIVAAGWLGFVRAVRSWRASSANETTKHAGFTSPNWWAALPVAASLLAIGVLLAASRSAPGFLWSSEFGGYDALSYHLQLPKEWIGLGRISPFEHNVYSYLPSYAEAAWYHMGVLASGLGSPSGFLMNRGEMMIACQVWHAIVTVMGAVVTGVLASALARDAGQSSRSQSLAGAVAFGLVVATPWHVVVGSLAYNEMVVVLLGASALIASRSAWLSPVWKGAITGMIVGGACGAKPTALLLIAPGAGFLLLGSTQRKHIVITVLACLGAGLISIAPWLVRNWLASGNPVFPSLAGLFGSGHWSAEQVARWSGAHHESSGVLDRLRLTVFADPNDPAGLRHRGMLHEQWGLFWIMTFIGACLGVALRQTRRVVLLLLAGLLVGLVAWLSVTHVQSRFLIPLAVFAAPVVAVCLGPIANRFGTKGIRIVAVVSASLVLAQAVQTWTLFGKQVPDEHGDGRPNIVGSAYLFAQFSPLAMIDESQMSPLQYASLALPDDARLMLLGYSTPAYLDADHEYTTTWDRSAWTDAVVASPGDPEAWTAAIRARGISHVLIDQGELRRLHESGYLDPDLDLDSLALWLHTVPVERAWNRGRYVLLRIEPE